jgi:hypothetical protein
MRIKGKKPGLNVETLIIPRGEDEPIVFTAKAVLDNTQFERLVKEPNPPVIVKRTGERVEDLKDPKYLKALEDFSEKQTAFLVLKSLEDTEGLEWETVNMGDPSTWPNFRTELKEAGFSNVEIGRIVNAVATANCLNESRLKEARDNFLATRQVVEANGQSHQNTEKKPTSSGESAKDSA